MEHPYGKQYSQEGNPRAYMTMRDYRNLPYQWQQPVGRNPNPNMSLREYRDKWMSAPVYHVPSTYPPPPQYDHPEPPFYASTPQSPQSQQPPPLSPVEQAVLNLSKMIGTIQEDQKVLNNQTNQRFEALESSVNRNLSNIHAEISRLSNQFVHQEEENLEEESQEEKYLTETVLVEQVQLQPHEGLKVESLETPEELQDAPVNFWPWTKEEEITALLTEKRSGHEGTQEPIIQPNPQAIPIDLDHNATAQPKNNLTANTKTTYSPLPVYILPMPAAQPKPAAPSPKAKSNQSLHAMKNLKILVAYVHEFATTSKAHAAAYTAWHSGWFWCGFGFGAPGPRHF